MRAAPRRACLVALLAAAPPGAGCASRAGGKVTAGAVESMQAEMARADAEGRERIAERAGRLTTDGALTELASPEGVERLGAVVDATVARSLEAALRRPGGTMGTVRGGGSGSLVDRMARQSATAFGAAFTLELERELGPGGRGPLAASLGGTVEQVAGSAVRGARNELGDLFPGCELGDRRACVEAEVRSLGRAAAAGLVEGFFGSAIWPAAALAFAVGVGAALAVRGALASLRRRRHAAARAPLPQSR